MVRDAQKCSGMLREREEKARETQRKNREERKHGKRREEKDQQEAILILKKICTTQTPDRPPLAAILVLHIHPVSAIVYLVPKTEKSARPE